MSLIISWLVLTLSVWAAASLLPGFHVNGFSSALKVAALFGVLNWLLGWLIFGVLGVASLGLGFLFAFLTRWVTNAILLKITDAISDNLKIDSFSHALLGSLVMSGVGTLAEYFLHLH